jgi:hypothetical protein
MDVGTLPEQASACTDRDHNFGYGRLPPKTGGTMPLQRLEHYLVLSDDIHGTRDFYRDVLGMAEGFRPELDDIGLKQVFLRDPNGVPIEINFRN